MIHLIKSSSNPFGLLLNEALNREFSDASIMSQFVEIARENANSDISLKGRQVIICRIASFTVPWVWECYPKENSYNYNSSLFG